MTKSLLVARIAARNRDVDSIDVRTTINFLLAAIAASLAVGNRVEIRGFGTFRLIHRAPRIGRNPATGKDIAIARRYVTRFKMGKALRVRVNDHLGMA